LAFRLLLVPTSRVKGRKALPHGSTSLHFPSILPGPRTPDDARMDSRSERSRDMLRIARTLVVLVVSGAIALTGLAFGDLTKASASTVTSPPWSPSLGW